MSGRSCPELREAGITCCYAKLRTITVDLDFGVTYLRLPEKDRWDMSAIRVYERLRQVFEDFTGGVPGEWVEEVLFEAFGTDIPRANPRQRPITLLTVQTVMEFLAREGFIRRSTALEEVRGAA